MGIAYARSAYMMSRAKNYYIQFANWWLILAGVEEVQFSHLNVSHFGENSQAVGLEAIRPTASRCWLKTRRRRHLES